MARKKTIKHTYPTLQLDKIKPYINNPRVITAEAVEDLAREITAVGYLTRIVVDEKKVILVGHTRLRALYHLEYDEAEVHQISGLTEEAKRQFRIADNKLGENSAWDYELLADELTFLDDAGDLFQELFTGFHPDEVAGILEPSPGTSTTSTEFNKSYVCPDCGHQWSDAD